jgi:hypothetical protein
MFEMWKTITENSLIGGTRTMKSLKQILEETEEFKGRTIYIDFIRGLIHKWLQQHKELLQDKNKNHTNIATIMYNQAQIDFIVYRLWELEQ